MSQNADLASTIILLPPHADLAAWAAERILERHRAELPDLGAVTLLVPTLSAIGTLRRRLAVQAGGTLLGPRICTLSQFAAERGSEQAPLPPAECRLILVGALRRYRNLFPGQDPWQLAEALFALFEEMSLNAVTPGGDEAAFAERLAGAYRTRPLAALSFEAQIVHRLWQAFREDTAGASPAEAYLHNLAGAFASVGADEVCCLAGFDTLARAEHAIVRDFLARNRASVWLQGRAEGRDSAATVALCSALIDAPPSVPAAAPAATPRSAFIDAVFAQPRRAPAPEHAPSLRITLAEHAEHEARCVELAVREALLDGHHRVAIVTEDRRLARRLRALLERAGLELQDEAGWALSTSAAAAALDAWLETIESRFHFRPLLNLAKSAFLGADAEALRVLERDIVVGREIEAGLDRFRRHATGCPALLALLDRFDEAARRMPGLAQTRSGEIWAEALDRSLEALGLLDTFRVDAAGQRLVTTLAELRSALARRPQPTGWQEFRALLGRSIESATFVGSRTGERSRVRLLTLDQSTLLRCDAVILAGATRARIPGAPPGEPFFNQSVRGELGLPNLQQRQALALARLRRVLEAAPLVRVTFAPESPGELPQLCPWIEAIESAAQAAGHELRDAALARRAGTAGVEIVVADAAAVSLPARRRTVPEPPAPSALLPQRFGATMHQALIDCPYRFFAGVLLGLRAERTPDEDPDRSDYGDRVHRILQAFIEPVRELPLPFDGAVTAANRDAAQAHLERLAEAVLADDLRSRALAHIWLTEFRASIPALLDWLLDRQAVNTLAEVRLERSLDPELALDGRADRLEQLAGGGLVVVDYKTGQVPRKGDVVAGEAVQLLHYALLDDAVARVEYLALKEGQRDLVIDEDLGELREAAGTRLRRLIDALRRERPLPAHGDDATCSHCDFPGVCRKGDWFPPDDDVPAATHAAVIALPRRSRGKPK